MDFVGETVAGGNTRLSDASGGCGFDEWGTPGSMEQAVWATEDDYVAWNSGGSSFETLSSEPPGKRLRSSHGGDAHVVVPNRSKAIGKMFFKTKLCCKFRAGVCPYITNCNFAHGMEELRMPPPNWQEIVAAHETEVGGVAGVEAPLPPPREEHQIPTISSPDLRGETQRSYKGRHCKKFYTEEGCPYGDTCSFLHDEQSRARESVAISVTPNAGGIGNSPTAPALKHSNWKTRICNKWEMTGYCPFGTKCHFAHGVDELHKFRGGLVEGGEGKDPSSLSHGVGFVKATENMAASTTSASCGDVYHLGSGNAPTHRPSCMPQRNRERAFHKWKGPDKISKIYGDWIDDIE